MIAAAERIRAADRRHRYARGHRAQRHQQVIDAVSREDEQWPVGSEATTQERLADRVSRGGGRAVAAFTPLSERVALSDQRPVRLPHCPYPQAVHHGVRPVTRWLG